MAVEKMGVDGNSHLPGKVRLQQKAVLRRQYIAQIPRWRHPFAGYLASIPIVGLAVLGVVLGKEFLTMLYFPGALLFLAVVLVALFWGVGPALFTVLISALALDYFYLPSSDLFNFTSGNGVLQVLPYVVAGIFIAVITGQRENARQKALFAEQIANEHADELAEINEELERTNQLKDSFISMASHELKTPITAIRGQAQITLRRLKKKHELTPELVPICTSLEKIDEQTYRLASLVDDLLDLSSLRAGKLQLDVHTCDMRTICQSVIEDQRLISGRTIEFTAPDTPVMVQADSERLSQVIVNLVGNALKYSPEDYPVRVQVYQQDHAAIVRVHDEGNGIPRDQQAHIFETFYRAPEAQSSKKDGWGLGLAICKDIVERHHGRIWCESEPDKGSTFVVEIPVQ